jgi:molecular chaperone GrpE (heat shock protein)
MNSSGRSSATAGVLADFLPVYDKLNQLKEKYANNDFGSKYGGLSMDATFAKMGVKEYAVAAGETVDNFRMAVGESEYSAEFAKDTVIRPVAGGMELEGNVIRAAECVASLGAEEKAQEDEEDSQKDETEETDSE